MRFWQIGHCYCDGNGVHKQTYVYGSNHRFICSGWGIHWWLRDHEWVVGGHQRRNQTGSGLDVLYRAFIGDTVILLYEICAAVK